MGSSVSRLFEYEWRYTAVRVCELLGCVESSRLEDIEELCALVSRTRVKTRGTHTQHDPMCCVLTFLAYPEMKVLFRPSSMRRPSGCPGSLAALAGPVRPSVCIFEVDDPSRGAAAAAAVVVVAAERHIIYIVLLRLRLVGMECERKLEPRA